MKIENIIKNILSKRITKEEWLSLKSGDTLTFRQSGKKRTIKYAEKGFVKLVDGGLYWYGDRNYFRL